MTKIQDKIAEIFNHCEHMDDEVGAKLAEEALALFSDSKRMTQSEKDDEDYYNRANGGQN